MASKLVPGQRRDGRGRFVVLLDESRKLGRLQQRRTIRPRSVLKMLERVGVK
jgi:hypothetical protein